MATRLWCLAVCCLVASTRAFHVGPLRSTTRTSRQLQATDFFMPLLASLPRSTTLQSRTSGLRAADTLPPKGFTWGVELTDEMEECLVDAENAQEQAACMGRDTDAAPSAPAVPAGASASPAEGVVTANRNDMLMGYNSKSLDECLVDAENAGEVEACNDDFDELVS